MDKRTKVFEQSDYCRRCGRISGEHVQHRDGRPPHCPGLDQPLNDVHAARHAQLHAMLDELVADWLIHTKKRPSSSTVLELMQWANEQRISPTHRDPRVRCEHCGGPHQGADCSITYPGGEGS